MKIAEEDDSNFYEQKKLELNNSLPHQNIYDPALSDDG